MLWRSDQTLQCNRTGGGFSVSLTVEPEDDETEVFGKAAGDLQDDILVGDSSISGTLKYITGYTQWSPGNPAEQEGNYLALKFTAPEGATTTVELVGGIKGPVELDSDMNAVFRIDDDHKKIRVITTTTAGVSLTKTYDLSNLILEEKEED